MAIITTQTSSITLNEQLPTLSSNIVLAGGGHYADGNGSMLVFMVGAAGNFRVDEIPIQHGSSVDGGGIFNDGYNLSSDHSCSFSPPEATGATLNLTSSGFAHFAHAAHSLDGLNSDGPGQQVYTSGAGSDAIGVIPNGTQMTA